MKKSKDSDSILIIAAETSSALYARRLLECWKAEETPFSFFGVGDSKMESLGFERLGKAEEMAVVGFQEVIKHYSDLKKVYDSILERCRQNPPRYALLLDYPGFNLKLAKDLKQLGIPVIYYISPQLWAWKKGRIKLVQKYVDKMLVLFPFEVEFYKKHNVSVEFVGHPLLDEIKPEYFDPEFIKEHRGRYGVGDEDLLLGLMPGSRNSELNFNLITQLRTAQKLASQNEKLKIALLVAPDFDIESVRQRIPQDFGVPLIFMQDEPMKMVSLTDLVLSASGTATLLVGLMEKPLVIMYKMNALTAVLAKVLVRGIEYFGMINLISGKEVAKEYFQSEATSENMSRELQRLIDDKDYYQSQVQDLREAKKSLGEKGGIQRVIDSLREYHS